MNDVLTLISTVLNGAWDMLTSIEIPGLGFSVAALLVGVVLVNLGFALLGYLLGFNFSPIVPGFVGMLKRDPEYRAGFAPVVPRISEARKNDEI